MDNLSDYISRLREDFSKGTLNEAETNKDPFQQFSLWLQQAVEAQIFEVQAMNLATVSHDLKPASRIVYLREFDNNQFNFYTNYNSRKAEQLSKNPYAALTFFWPELERQIRIEGIVEKISEAQSDAYFNARPYESKIGAWASNQSHALRSREELEQNVDKFKSMYSAEEIKRPDYWGGFSLKASYYEFWQGRKSRLHDRITYTADNNDWIITRIAP